MATRSGRPSLDLHNNLLGCLIGWVFYLEITLPPTKLSRFLYQVNEVIVKERQEIDSSLLGSLNQRIKGSKDQRMPSMKVVSEEPRRCPVKSRFTAIVFSLFLLRELIGIGFTFCSLRITKAMRASARKAGNDCKSALRFFAKYSLAKKAASHVSLPARMSKKKPFLPKIEKGGGY